MAKYFEKQSVLSIIETFGNDDIYKAICGLTEYNDDANRTNYGEWQNVELWQLFEPQIDTSADDILFHMQKINFHSAYCSNCHATITIDDYDNYCPRCGARMSYTE